MTGEAQENEYRKLISLGILRVKTEVALEQIGRLVDLSFDLRREEDLQQALRLCDELQRKRLTPGQFATLNYFRANAWGDLHLLRREGREQIWDWDLPEIEQEIIALRIAARAEGIAGFPHLRLCQIFTNLGNTFDCIGRFVEATSYWRRTLALEPRFSMATSNLGYALYHYAAVMHDPGQASIFLAIAAKYLEEALASHIDSGARRSFEGVLAQARKALDGRRPRVAVTSSQILARQDR